MPTEPELLADVVAKPFEDAPRRAYADFLDTQPEAPSLRAEFIRLQLDRTGPIDQPPSSIATDPDAELVWRMQYLRAEQRERELLQAHGQAWAAEPRRAASEVRYDRGFVASVVVDAPKFVKFGAWLMQQAPIVHVELRDVVGALDALVACPALAKVGALSVHSQGIDDHALARLIASPHLRDLWWLELGKNAIGMGGLDALASARLPRLRYAGFQGNPVDPHETAGVHGHEIQDVALPPEGEALEAKHGHLPWLHFSSGSLLDFPPNPRRAPPP